jgi:ribosomal protein S18 acetylase RimI-like enzyme
MPLVLQPSWRGQRVTVRRVLDRDASGRLRFGDVVGDLLELDDEFALIDTRTGPVQVAVRLIAAAKLAPPSSAEELAVEHVIAQGWRAADTERLGGWLLRAAGGFTGRANSVLPLRAPGMPLEDALAGARRWYAARGLPAKFQVPVESRRLLDAELAERGWPASPDVHVMTARLDLLVPSADDRDVHLAASPSPDWYTLYRGGAGAQPAARGILTRHDNVVFATVRGADGAMLAIGRGTVDAGWLGVTAVEVAAENRRAGLARAVLAALWSWGGDAGATRTHLEVSSDNLAALALYEGLGYHTHHLYRYRTEPAGARET